MIFELDCTEEFTNRFSESQTLLFDRLELEAADTPPLIRVGTFPPTPSSAVNISLATTSDETDAIRFPYGREEFGPLSPSDRFVGSVESAVDFISLMDAQSQGEVEGAREAPRLEPELEPEDLPPFEQEGALEQSPRIAPGYDPRLRYITIHCTGPGIMSEGSIREYARQGKRNKGHGYIQPDGKYITVQSIL